MIKITTLGDFRVNINGKNVTGFFKKKNKLLMLLNLLILNIDKPLSVEYICNDIWKDSEADSPKALHNIVYRLRIFFAAHGIMDCIIYNSKTYMLNPALDWEIDIYQMEQYNYRTLELGLSVSDKIHFLEKVIDLYGGEYILSQICENLQALYTANRYKRMHSNTVCALIDLYLRDERYDCAIELCEKAIVMEPFDEQVIIRFVKAFESKEMFMKATVLLDDYFKHLYAEMGMHPSNTLIMIYNRLKGWKNDSKSTLRLIANDFKGVSGFNKPFFCNLDTFKEIYRYKIRQSSRSELLVLLILVEIYSPTEEELSEWLLEKATKSFFDSCMHVLRKSDVFAYNSKSSMIIMLTLNENANVSSILERLNKRFYSEIDGSKLSIKTQTILEHGLEDRHA